MKRTLVVLLALALAATAWAELRAASVSATDTSQTVTLNAAEVFVLNTDSTNEIYVRVFEPADTVGDATTSGAYIGPGAAVTYSRPNGIKAISIVCASTETATVKLHYW